MLEDSKANVQKLLNFPEECKTILESSGDVRDIQEQLDNLKVKAKEQPIFVFKVKVASTEDKVKIKKKDSSSCTIL
ncbi:hypothetical protein L3V83_05190 [Thiotrichales bacterium 19X7-9]|nr:hypothetical protein [Thiotrichales bacterium 19X7-9]